MPFFVHRETGALHPRTSELLEAVAKRGEQGWHRGVANAGCVRLLGDEAKDYVKNPDTLDVWFDSGTHETVLRGSHVAQSRFPADMYLEGLTSIAAGSIRAADELHDQRRAPYDALLTHGFVVDGTGRKMSKSLRQCGGAAEGVGHARRGNSAPVGRGH